MEEQIVALLLKHNLTLSSYESITGGLFANTITNIPNASKIFPGGLITYSNYVKSKNGKVSKQIIQKYGVVSYEVAAAMADKCQKQFKTDLAVSFTGNAGPTALDNLPIGLVFIGVKYHSTLIVEKLLLDPHLDRITIKKLAVEKALTILLEIIK
ncbi:competence damage-inducible protein A [Spiroplasma syrphidicola EA-1]|uniref:Competence damage-inducible protein A n=1 Tax=Spiroplasma syrphidicola EA-1 TaxID=1276229 RepID=R4UIX2_9MOLU|nr:CinA family protein [Spiroplasma syrphidicola]AGM26100.1 competence damage-inducible protein A [Spiroplasma syrphidicola EA-1]